MNTSNTKFKVRLPTKSHAAAFIDVLQIVERNPHRIEGKFQFVTFDEPTSDLEELLTIAKSLSAFKFFIDNEEIKKSDVSFLKWILFCENSATCNGICTHGAIRNPSRFEKYSISDIIRIINERKSIDVDPDEYYELLIAGKRMNWLTFQETETHNRYIINKRDLSEKIKEGLKRQTQFCPIIDCNAIEQKLEEIPLEIEEEKPSDETLEDDSMPVSLTEEQIDLIANKIAHAITKGLRELFEEAGILTKKPE